MGRHVRFCGSADSMVSLSCYSPMAVLLLSLLCSIMLFNYALIMLFRSPSCYGEGTEKGRNVGEIPVLSALEKPTDWVGIGDQEFQLQSSVGTIPCFLNEKTSLGCHTQCQPQ